MAENSKIEWTDHTFNPWLGCTKVSPACAGCYAESWAKRTGNPQLWQGARRRTTIEYWQQPFRWNDRAKAAGRRDRVFCASLADVFDNVVSNHWRWDLFALIRATRHLDWLLLTKRIGNAREMLNSAASSALDTLPGTPSWDLDPWPNVWLGATVANQEEADRDIPKLLATPARIRFLSIEPMLGPIKIRSEWLDGMYRGDPFKDSVGFLRHQIRYGRHIDWVIAGGESGGGARPVNPAWVRGLRDQCQLAGVPFLFKQWGEWAPGGAHFVSDAEPKPPIRKSHRWPIVESDPLGGSWSFRIGKTRAGRLLDGRTWDQFPEAHA